MRFLLALLLVQLGCLQVTAQGARPADPVPLKLDDGVEALVFSPDGGTVYGGGGRGTGNARPIAIRAWDSVSGKLRWEQRGQNLSVASLAVTPDGTLLASAGSSRGMIGPNPVQLWDAASGKLIAKLEGHVESIYSVAFSPDGARLVSAGGDGTVRVWDVATRKQVATGRSPWMAATQASFLPDGKAVLFGSQNGILTVWEWESGKEIASARGHKGNVVTLSVSADGRRAASVGNDSILRLVDPASIEKGVTLQGPEPRVRQASLSPDGRFLASVADDAFRIWEVATSKEALRIEGAWAPGVFSPDGRRIATGQTEWDGKIFDLAALATVEKVPDAAKALCDANATAAYRASWGLVLQGDAGVAWLKPRLLTPPAPAAVAKAFAGLDEDDIRVRESAFQELLGYGPAIQTDVLTKLQGNPPEQLKRPLEDLQRRLEGPVAGSPYLLERTRSIFVLETIGSAAAVAVLEELSRSGKSGLERTESAAALKRLKK